jgi:hypothetical protein
MILQQLGQDFGQGITGITWGRAVADGELIEVMGGKEKMRLDVPIFIFWRQKAFNFTTSEKVIHSFLDGIVHLFTLRQKLK